LIVSELPTDSNHTAPAATPQRIVVGRINQTWGLKGHVKVTPFTSNPERLTTGAQLYVSGQHIRVLESISPQGYPIMQFTGYTTREAAQTLRDELIEIDEDTLPELAPDQYYVDDLQGLSVVSSTGDKIGELVEVLTTGANDVYVVRRPDEKDVLIPAIVDILLNVDLEARRMTIQVIPGLLPD
jgi:16S rRNA processing protein RimM